MKAFTPYRPARSWFRPFWKRPQRIGQHWEHKADVTIFPDGREVCNPSTDGGQFEYRLRVWLMWVRQDGLCCNCRTKLSMKEATFEHETPRSGGQRDDRIAIFNKAGGLIRHLNGASHWLCNFYRGSRRTPIWHGTNCVAEF